MVTLIHYEDDLNIPTTEDFLIPVEQIVEGAQEQKPDEEAPSAEPV